MNSSCSLHLPLGIWTGREVANPDMPNLAAHIDQKGTHHSVITGPAMVYKDLSLRPLFILSPSTPTLARLALTLNFPFYFSPLTRFLHALVLRLSSFFFLSSIRVSYIRRRATVTLTH